MARCPIGKLKKDAIEEIKLMIVWSYGDDEIRKRCKEQHIRAKDFEKAFSDEVSYRMALLNDSTV